VNRNDYDVKGRQMSIPAEVGVRYFDLYHGVELTPERGEAQAVLSFSIEAHGMGAVMAVHGAPDASIDELMLRMKKMTEAPLSSFAHEWKLVGQRLVGIEKTKPAAAAPEEMVKIPAGDYVFKVQGIEIEGQDDVGVDVQYSSEDSPRRFHEHRMHVNSFYLDKYTVTNAGFKKFLDATHYHPQDGLSFPRDWKNDSYPQGWDKKPVTWVSLEDAHAYAKWAGKRLPHEWEW
jgi:gamma-glutamyl hercynylcysteine S-oxide synthase